MNLWEGLAPRAGRRSNLHVHGDGAYRATSWSEVFGNAAGTTLGLRRIGVRPGTRVATLLSNSSAAVTGLCGAWLAGAAVASLPMIARGMSVEEYRRQVAEICAQLEPTAFLVDASNVAAFRDALPPTIPVVSFESLIGSGSIDLCPPGDDEVAFIQYSSGSCGPPKGCMLTPRAISAQLAMLAELFGAEPGVTSGVSWLPLSHDMGLFGILMTGWLFDGSVFLSSPERFVFSPRSWFEDVVEFGAEITAGTNTALDYAARAQSGYRLDGPIRLRACVVGAERVEYPTIRRALEAFGPFGLTADCLMPAYGLAEATLAVTARHPGEPLRVLDLDGNALADGSVIEVSESHESATRIVGSGRSCRGVEVRGLTSDKVAPLRIVSPSLSEGYYGDPERSGEYFVGDELVTGDVGFERDGEIFVVGRDDDMIQVAGRNVYARELEAAVDQLDGVRAGCSTIVADASVNGSRLVLLVEVRGEGDAIDPHRLEAIANAAAALAMTKAAVVVDEVVFLAKGQVPKTPSGKIQRHRCAQAIAAGTLGTVAAVKVGPRIA